MNFKSFSKIAGVSAIALIAAVNATGINTAVAQYVLGTDQTVLFNADAIDSITVNVTPGEFGDLAGMDSTADTATATLVPDIAVLDITDDHSTGFGTAEQAHIVGSDGTASPAIVAVSGAFFNEDMFVTFTNCQNLTDGVQNFVLTNITTSLGGAGYDCVAPMATGETFTTDGTGAFTFYVGADITTEGAIDGVYQTGTYTGSVDMQITY